MLSRMSVREIAPVRLQESRVRVAVRGAAMRISPHVYNNDGDIERLLETLRQLIR